MYQNKRFLAVIPARGGSKGVPRKNIRLLHGQPLIYWTIEAAKQSKYLDRVIISSEDAEIATIAQQLGAEVPFIRPQALAQDDTPGMTVILHALATLSESYDYVIILQPTSPLRTAQHIDAGIAHCLQQQAAFCVSVCAAEPHPYWTFTLAQDRLSPLFTDIPFRRQELPECYSLNGAFYCASVPHLQAAQQFDFAAAAALVMDAHSSVDIDTEFDFAFCQWLMGQSIE